MSDYKSLNTSEGGENDSFAKPLYGLTPVSRVQIPPSPPEIHQLSPLLRASQPQESSDGTGDRLQGIGLPKLTSGLADKATWMLLARKEDVANAAV